MIAAKGSPVWARLGSLEDYPDGLDGGLPPFAFGSQRGWQGVTRKECTDLGVALDEAAAEGLQGPRKAPADRLPVPVAKVPPVISEAGLAALRAAVGGKVKAGRLTFEERLAKSLAPARAKAEAEAEK